MKHSKTISLECPHCITKCQFLQVDTSHKFCAKDKRHHIAYNCTNCCGVISTKWKADTEDFRNFQNSSGYNQLLDIYYPLVGDWNPRVDIALISNSEVRSDFEEAINCYNNDLYNACMMMARRAIQQEMIINQATGKNLYEQIESMGISNRLKSLLHKIKNFGNHGAHPDFCLFDKEENEVNDKKEFAKLSLEFLDRYFSNEYEIDALVNGSPKSKKELEP